MSKGRPLAAEVVDINGFVGLQNGHLDNRIAFEREHFNDLCGDSEAVTVRCVLCLVCEQLLNGCMLRKFDVRLRLVIELDKRFLIGKALLDGELRGFRS